MEVQRMENKVQGKSICMRWLEKMNGRVDRIDSGTIKRGKSVANTII